MTPSVGRTARFRARAESALRAYFAASGVLEVTVPSMVASPGMEPQLRAFEVHPREALEFEGRYLHTSPEFAIKATLAEVGCDVFTLARTFRDEPPGRWHHPEFTMLEWYRRDAPYEQLMNDCEAIVRAVAALAENDELDQRVAAPFFRTTLDDAFLARVGCSVHASAAELAAALRAHAVDFDDAWGWDELFSLAYSQVLEPTFRDHPTFVSEFPARVAALARLCQHDPRVAERFELYLPTAAGGVELANAFGELVDPIEQRARFEADLAERRSAGRAVYPMPEALLAGIARLGCTSGIALGWERLLGWTAIEGHGWDVGVADWLVGEPPALR